MEPEILEVLMGKYIDGEVTEREMEILDEELERNFEARELLAQLQELDKQSRGAVSSEVLWEDKEASEVFERAWQRRKRPLLGLLGPGWMRFVTGLAAGLLVGIGLHVVMAGQAPSGVQGQGGVVQGPHVPGGVQTTATVEPSKASPKTVRRNVDWFSFTDKDGDEWIVEGLRKDVIRPASYSKEL